MSTNNFKDWTAMLTVPNILGAEADVPKLGVVPKIFNACLMVIM